MTIRKVTRRGETRLVLDIHYRKPDGTPGRYRKDAQVQTMAAARAEERRLLALIVQHGEPHEPAEVPDSAPAKDAPEAPTTFADAVAIFRSGKAITKLKPSTRSGYEEILSTRLLPRFGERRVDELAFEEATKLDAEMVQQRLSPSRRRNVQIVIRSVLHAAVDGGKLAAMPKLPALPKKGRKILVPLTRDQIERLLAASPPAQRIAFALAAYAGLRAGEVRALRWADVDLDAGLLVVRFSHSKGETSTPKSGHEREVPLAPQLLAELQAARRCQTQAQARQLVSTTSRGKPWGEFGLNQALKRALRKAGLEGAWRFHDLRHFFVTQLFRRGGAAPAVQALAGHLHLATTQRYAHMVQADLRQTIGLLATP